MSYLFFCFLCVGSRVDLSQCLDMSTESFLSNFFCFCKNLTYIYLTYAIFVFRKRRRNQDRDDDDDDDGFFGPALPPGFKKQDDSPPRPIIGPALPPGFIKSPQKNDKGRENPGQVSPFFNSEVWNFFI